MYDSASVTSMRRIFFVVSACGLILIAHAAGQMVHMVSLLSYSGHVLLLACNNTKKSLNLSVTILSEN